MCIDFTDLFTFNIFREFSILTEKFICSNPDLSHFGVSEAGESFIGAENETEPSFSLAFATRNQKGKGAVQKRVSLCIYFFLLQCRTIRITRLISLSVFTATFSR